MRLQESLNKADKKKSIAMLLLVLYPILRFYPAPIEFMNFGSTVILFYLLIVSASDIFKNIRNLGVVFLCLWGYMAITTMASSGSFNFNWVFLGGPEFFFWSLFLAFFAHLYDYNLLKKTLRVVFIVSTAIFLIQDVQYSFSGTRFVPVLHIDGLYLYCNLTYAELADRLSHVTRSMSLFMEPSYFGQFLLMFTCVELFCRENKDKLFNIFSLTAIVVIVFLQSGVGMVGLTVLMIIKFVSYYGKNKGRLFLSMLFVLPVIFYIIHLYAQSDMGIQMLNRSNEFSGENENASGYLRLMFGFSLYDSLPIINKIFGANGELTSFAGNLLHDDGINYNMLQDILLNRGLVGLLIFILFYRQIFRGGSILTKSLIIIVLIISLLESMYQFSLILVITVIALMEKNDKKGTLDK